MASFQQIGHIIVNGEVIHILERSSFGRDYSYTSIKLRKGKNPDRHIGSVGEHLEQNPELLARLKAGETLRM